MRRVIEHSTQQLQAALDREHTRAYPDKQTIAALAYAIGVQQLLASYLVVTDTPTPDRPAVDRDGPRDGGLQDVVS